MFGSGRQKLVDNAAMNDADDVILQWRQSSLRRSWDVRQCIFTPYCDGFAGEFDPLNVVGHRVDPKKGLAHSLSHYPSKSAQNNTLVGESGNK